MLTKIKNDNCPYQRTGGREEMKIEEGLALPHPQPDGCHVLDAP